MGSPFTPLNGAQSRPFYVIAHNPNSVDEAEEALKNGVNCLEPDITEVTCNGEILINFDSDVGIPAPCSESRLLEWCDGVNLLAQKYPQLALVLFDIKKWAAYTPGPVQIKKNAADILDAARNHLNANGVNLNVIYSTSEFDFGDILLDMLQSGLNDREAVSLDEEDSPADVVTYFFNHGYTENIGFGDGTAGPGPNLPRIMDLAAYLRASTGYPKILSDVFLISQVNSMHSFIDGGADGIIVTDATQKTLIDAVNQFHPEVHLGTREENPFHPVNEAYGVQVHTASGFDAGTDSHIQFTLNGCRGSSTIIVNTGDIYPGYDTARMRSGHDDWTTIPSKDIGELQSITIESLGPDEPFSGWDLTEVHVSSARYIGPNFFVNGLPSREYQATFNGTIKVGQPVTLPLTPNFELPSPTIKCPGPIVVKNDPGQCGAIVNFTPEVSGLCDDLVAVCDPPSGSLFPSGTTVVTCTAKNGSGKTSAPCTFTVTVIDGEFPVITCPAPLVIDATSPAGAIATFAPAVSDNCPGVVVICTPASGSVFPVGDTTVNCTATDAANNQSSCSFNIHVKGAAEQTADLITAVNNLNGPNAGIKNALLAKLTLALAKIQGDNPAPACGALKAFIDQVSAQKVKTISPSDADYLVAAATQIGFILGCN